MLRKSTFELDIKHQQNKILVILGAFCLHIHTYQVSPHGGTLGTNVVIVTRIRGYSELVPDCFKDYFKVYVYKTLL